jgi:hypothetical protein
MNRSQIFSAAHRSTRFEINTRAFAGCTYAQVFRIVLRRVYKNARIAKENVTKFRVKIAYKNVNLRNLLKAKKAQYDPATATWVVTAKPSHLGLLKPYVVPYGNR